MHENELLMLILGLCGLCVVASNRPTFRAIPHSRLLLVAYCFLVCGWSATVLESFWWEAGLNFLEHLAYAVSAILTASWTWLAFHGREAGR